MTVEPRDILPGIASRAATITERIAALHSRGDGGDHGRDRPPRARYDLWSEAMGGAGKLPERLSVDGLDEAGAIRLVDGLAPALTTLPSWATVLGEALDYSESGEAIRLDDPAPFEDAFFPLVRKAVAMMRLDGASRALIESSRQTLMTRLAGLWGQTLEAEFGKFRPFGLGITARFARESASREHYLRFCADLREGALAKLCERYSALARLTGIAIESWIAEGREFAGRLAADIAVIEAVFSPDRPLGEPEEVNAGVSDLHRGARCVRIVRFANGCRVVYKPRDCSAEAAWRGLIEYINADGQLLDLWHPPTLCRNGYAWIGYVPERECADAVAVGRYYRRAGMLLCLAYALHGSDLHHENVLASGEYPVLIDLETLFVPEQRLGGQVAEFTQSRSRFRRSVLPVGLLPRWEAVPGGNALDTGGFSARDPGETAGDRPMWRFPNTDLMHRAMMPMPMDPTRNVPSLGGRVAAPEGHVTAIVEGFAAMYGFLMRSRQELLSDDGPLAAFRGCPARVLFRNTQFYGRLMKQSLAPRNLEDGVALGLALEVLYRSWLLDSPSPDAHRIARAEICDMERLDTPHFTIPNDEAEFSPDGGPRFSGLFARGGWQDVRDTLANLNDGDKARQCAYIRAAFQAKVGRHVSPAAQTAARRLAPVLSDTELVDRAIGIARRIRGEALGSGADPVWIDLQEVANSGRYHLQPMSRGLWGGTAGVGVFFAACYAVTGDPEYRELSLAALATARAGLVARGVDPDFARAVALDIGLGAGEGLGSLMLAFVQISRLLGEPGLAEDAARLARLVTAESLAKGELLDYLTGAAGALVGCLAVHEARGDADALKSAIACGERLLAHQRADGSWITMRGQAPYGFAHGSAGIGYSLYRLYEAVGETRWLDAARAAVRFEHAGLDRERDNWPRPAVNGEPPVFMSGWCHGGVGIGLARLAQPRLRDEPDSREDIAAALRLVDSGPDPGVDQLCCGVFGQIELLLAAGDREKAVHRASAVVAEAEANGGYRLFESFDRSVVSFGLGQGLAGIGYGLLRVALPERIPSVVIPK
jgi:type 2 lantibiotic biosynthesis protein LanM